MTQDSTTGTSLGSDVFVSYASQDAAVANSIVENLEKQGLRCWIAPRDVVPGSLYADEIVRAINEAKVLVLVLSEHAIGSPHVGKEIERASSKRRRIIALHTDSAPLTRAFEYFLSESQWVDVPTLGMPAALSKLAEAVRQGSTTSQETVSGKLAVGTKRRIGIAAAAIMLGVAIALGLHFWASNFGGAQAPANASAGLASPEKSIAVLPFTDMSEKKDQEYFADGLSEELINALALIEQLQVAARTSSFSFKGQPLDVETIGHKLHVGAVLEGSVRRSGNTVRVTAQLINASNGFHIWSHTYDRDLKDVLAVQSDIAIAVAQQLQAKLLGNEAGKIEVGGTQNPQAYDAYLRATQLYSKAYTEDQYRTALAAFDQAIALDSSFAAAHGGRAFSLLGIANRALDLGMREDLQKKAGETAGRAIALAPDSGEAHLAAAVVYRQTLEFGRAASEFDRALALAPGSAQVQSNFATFAGLMGHFEAAKSAARRGVRLDPQNDDAHLRLAGVLYNARLFNEAIAAAQEAKAINPDQRSAERQITDSYLAMGRNDLARQMCESPATVIADDNRHFCLALAYHALRLPAEAQAELQKLRALGWGDARAVSYADLYAQWGDTRAALDWLATAERTRAAALQFLKVSWFLDPIRNEPEFKALERRLNFPP
ncbi:MAG TPA: TIR domain-containing protein [Steroidobacteraceae bacterium]|jgi:TolB-like protein|nr:TIR domain-containing protein [Steroidobacteraceae bacterium]